MKISEKIKSARKAAGLNQQQLADLMGYSRVYINYLENDKYNPSVVFLKKMADSLKIDKKELFIYL